MITHRPSDLQNLLRERDAVHRDYTKLADAAADLIGRLHAMVSAGTVKAFAEMEAVEIALSVPRDGEAKSRRG